MSNQPQRLHLPHLYLLTLNAVMWQVTLVLLVTAVTSGRAYLHQLRCLLLP